MPRWNFQRGSELLYPCLHCGGKDPGNVARYRLLTGWANCGIFKISFCEGGPLWPVNPKVVHAAQQKRPLPKRLLRPRKNKRFGSDCFKNDGFNGRPFFRGAENIRYQFISLLVRLLQFVS
jgi:hypothetical protein